MQASFLRLSATRMDPEAVLGGRGQPEELECDGNGLGPPAPDQAGIYSYLSIYLSQARRDGARGAEW